MCFGRPRAQELPEPPPPDSAIEPTADRVVVGANRSSSSRDDRRMSTTAGRKRLGTRSLRIPLLVRSANSNNINYS